MNINAIELLSLDKKNMNYGLSAKEAPAEPSTLTKPENIMNAMHMQSANNIAFGKTAKIVKGATAVAAGAILAACSLVNRQDVNIDIANSIDNELMEAILAKLDTIAQNTGNASDFYATATAYMMNDENRQTLIQTALESSGLTLEEIEARIAHIEQMLMGSNPDYVSAYAEIIALLGGINANVAHIDSVVTALFNRYEAQQNQYDADKAAWFGILTNIDTNVGITRENSDSLLIVGKAIANDSHNMSQTAITIQNLVGDNSDKLDSIQANQKDQMDLDVYNATIIGAKLDTISSKLGSAGAFPGYDQTAILNEIDAIRILLQNNLPVTNQQLQALNEKADSIYTAVLGISQEVGNISNKMTQYYTGYADDMAGYIDDLKSVITAGFSAVDARQASAEAQLGLVVNYNAQLNEKADTIISKMDQNKPLTAAELSEILDVDFATLTNTLGLKLDLNNVTLAQIRDSLSHTIAYQQQHLTILGQIKDLLKENQDILIENWPAVLAKLDALIECCENCNSNTTNEGVNNDLNDIFGAPGRPMSKVDAKQKLASKILAHVKHVFVNDKTQNNSNIA